MHVPFLSSLLIADTGADASAACARRCGCYPGAKRTWTPCSAPRLRPAGRSSSWRVRGQCLFPYLSPYNQAVVNQSLSCVRRAPHLWQRPPAAVAAAAVAFAAGVIRGDHAGRWGGLEEEMSATSCSMARRRYLPRCRQEGSQESGPELCEDLQGEGNAGHTAVFKKKYPGVQKPFWVGVLEGTVSLHQSKDRSSLALQYCKAPSSCHWASSTMLQLRPPSQAPTNSGARPSAPRDGPQARPCAYAPPAGLTLLCSCQ